MNYSDLCPAASERMLIVGRTGSGKSTLTKHLLETLSKDELIIIFDTKQEYDIGNAFTRALGRTLYRPLPTVNLKRLESGVFIYQPSYPEIRDVKVPRILNSALKRKKCTIVIHEINDFSRGGYVLPVLGKVIRQGRSKDVRMFLETQRPAGMPLIALTEANRVACFRLRSLDDRKRMAQWVDPHMMDIPPKFSFWYADDSLPDAVLLRGNK